MVLVPHDSVARLHDPPTSSPQIKMSALDSEMSHILQKQYVDDSEKWKKYNETLQRYLHFVKEGQKPVSIEIASVPEKEGVGNESLPSSGVRHQVASVIPKTYKDQALKIFDYLSVVGSPITWDSQGVVSVKGAHVAHSNIVDLISDLTRHRKNFEPVGVTKFVEGLAELNIPLELVGNDKRRTAVLQAKQRGRGLEEPPPPPLSETKRALPPVVKRSAIKQHVWKSW